MMVDPLLVLPPGTRNYRQTIPAEISREEHRCTQSILTIATSVAEGEEIDGGPATLVVVDDFMRPVLERWLAGVLNAPGCPAVYALSADEPTEPTAAARPQLHERERQRRCVTPAIGRQWQPGSGSGVRRLLHRCPLCPPDQAMGSS